MKNNLLDIELSGEIFDNVDLEYEIIQNKTNEPIVITPLDNGKFSIGEKFENHHRKPAALENTGLPYVGKYDKIQLTKKELLFLFKYYDRQYLKLIEFRTIRYSINANKQ